MSQQNQNYHRFPIDNRNNSSSNLNNQNGPYVAATVSSNSNSNPPMVINQHSYRPYHPEHHYPQSFAQPYQARPQVYQQSFHHQQQQYTMMQQTDHHHHQQQQQPFQ